MKNILESWKSSLVGGGFIALSITDYVSSGDWHHALYTFGIGLLGLLLNEKHSQ